MGAELAIRALARSGLPLKDLRPLAAAVIEAAAAGVSP